MNDTIQAQVEQIDPATIHIEDNVREAVDLPSAFVASIKQHGVLVPVLAWRDTDGTVHVRDGQRRTLAAREAGLAAMPAFITDRDGDTKDRIVQQIVTNDQRDSLTEHDRIAGYAALALEGMSVTAIAKATGAKRDTVKGAVAIAASPTATEHLAAGTLDFDAALALAEFDGDDQAQAAILETIEYGGSVANRVAGIREDRRKQAILDAATADLAEQGITVLDDDSKQQAERLTSLTDDEGDGIGDAITADAHTECPGDAVGLYVPWQGEEARTEHYCTRPDLHRSRYGQASTPQRGPMTDEQKQERRTLIANNKAWDTAEAERRAWLSTFLARKTLPKDAAAFAAATLAASGPMIDHSVLALAATLTGAEDRQAFEDEARTRPARATHTLVGLAVASIDAHTSRDSWRSPREPVAEYLRRLATWGYALTDVEKIVTGDTE